MLEKQIAISRIEVLNDQTVVVRYLIKIIENGNLLTEDVKSNYIRPGDDYSTEDAKVQAICSTVHTVEVVEAYKAAQKTTPA
jgi:archaellum component FlaF (FlaF/FlaG flagellin family)